jgi:hypothetical protein
MNIRRTVGLIGSACIGAGVMFLADPRMGRRRRSLIMDKFASADSRVRRIIEGRSEDLKNRVYGLYCEVKGLIGSRCEPEHKTRLRRVG